VAGLRPVMVMVGLSYQIWIWRDPFYLGGDGRPVVLLWISLLYGTGLAGLQQRESGFPVGVRLGLSYARSRTCAMDGGNAMRGGRQQRRCRKRRRDARQA
jgi:hypothetical protein